ncbi:uncharacterized protein [Solanum lycopersicum]|uniref:uncharacterized protein n=1 Tax=Solanum lycopersicum TaxID=4081 RepID=UPI0037497AFA
MEKKSQNARLTGPGAPRLQEHLRGSRQKWVDTLRIQEFLRMNPQSFTGSSTIEDPYNITEKMRKVYEVMHIAGIEIAELASYQLKGLDRLGLISGRREFPKKKQCNSCRGNRAQSSSFAPPDRAAPRGTTSSADRGTNRLYALNNRQEHENSQWSSLV